MNPLSLFRYALASAGMALSLSVAAAPAPASAPAPIFVLNSLNANVSVIDPVTYTELRRVPTGKEPHHLYLTPDGQSLMVANALGDSITLLDPRTGEVQRTLTGIVDPYHLRFSPDMKWFVTAANRLNHVDIYAYRPLGPGKGFELTLAKRIPAGKTPSHIVIDSDSKVAYVTLQDSNEVMAIDLATQQPLWTLPVGSTPADVFLTRDDKTLLVALTGDSHVEAYDLSVQPPRLIQRIKTGAGAHAFRALGDGRHLFVSNRAANTISRIDMDTLTVTQSFAAPGGPDCMDISADGKQLLVTSRWAGKLTFIDLPTGKVTQQVRVGKSPHGVWTLDHAPMR